MSNIMVEIHDFTVMPLIDTSPRNIRIGPSQFSNPKGAHERIYRNTSLHLQKLKNNLALDGVSPAWRGVWPDIAE